MSLPATTRLGGVVLQVSDLERSLSYYWEVLGLKVLERSGNRADLGITGASPIVSLVERKGAGAVPPGGALGLYHFAILLPDRPALGRFLLHLAELGVRAGMSDHLVSEAIYLQDPDNLGIEVYADRPRSEWRRERNGQLSMSTKPLDAHSVAAAAGVERWSGAPSGTTLGHMHLHVGSIEQAESFYHGAIGFDITVSTYPGALFMSAGGYHHHLGVNTWAKNAAPAAAEDARLMEWEIVVPTADDVAAVEKRMRSASNDVARDGNSIVASDPWGSAVRVVQG
jgi:catechol 2,3-dioxygenase